MRFVLIAALVAAGCAPRTSFEQTWSAPGHRVALRQVATVFLAHDVSIRRASEDRLAQVLARHGVRAVPAYAALAGAEALAPGALFAELRAAGFDGVVIMRVLGKRRELDTPPGGYEVAWDEAWTTDFTGDQMPETVIRIETTAYALGADGRLVWAGLSRSIDPHSLRDLIDGITQVVTRELRAHGVIAT